MSADPAFVSRTDVAIIGSGPAGMSAAIACAEAGVSVSVYDMQTAPGGQIYRRLEANLASHPTLIRVLGPSYSEGSALIARFRKTPGITYFPNTIVWHTRSDGALTVKRHGETALIQARHIILAHGAMERPAPFPGWTLPGVMTAGAAQTILKSSGAIPSGPTVLAGAGPLLLLVAYQLAKLGTDIRAVLLTSRLHPACVGISPALRALQAPGDLAKGLSWFMGLRRRGVALRTGVSDLVATGDDKLRQITYRRRGKDNTLAADTLLVHDGIVPATDMTAGSGCAMIWAEDERAWQPVSDSWGQTDVTKVSVTGDARVIGGAKAAGAHGALTGLRVASSLGAMDRATWQQKAGAPRLALQRALSIRPLMTSLFPLGLSRNLPTAETLICRCEEVTRQQIDNAATAGIRDINQLKALTRCGMGPCQGRSCGATTARVFAEATQRDMIDVGPFRARLPARPVTVQELSEMAFVPKAADPSPAAPLHMPTMEFNEI